MSIYQTNFNFTVFGRDNISKCFRNNILKQQIQNSTMCVRQNNRCFNIYAIVRDQTKWPGSICIIINADVKKVFV